MSSNDILMRGVRTFNKLFNKAKIKVQWFDSDAMEEIRSLMQEVRVFEQQEKYKLPLWDLYNALENAGAKKFTLEEFNQKAKDVSDEQGVNLLILEMRPLLEALQDKRAEEKEFAPKPVEKPVEAPKPAEEVVEKCDYESMPLDAKPRLVEKKPKAETESKSEAVEVQKPSEAPKPAETPDAEAKPKRDPNIPTEGQRGALMYISHAVPEEADYILKVINSGRLTFKGAGGLISRLCKQHNITLDHSKRGQRKKAACA